MDLHLEPPGDADLPADLAALLSGAGIGTIDEVLPLPAWVVPVEAASTPSNPLDRPSPRTRPAARQAAAPSPTAADAEPAADGGDAGHALDDDVLVFLIGKRVGRDVFDAENRLIVARGGLIDDGLVRRVAAAGRLPELIVHMTLADD